MQCAKCGAKSCLLLYPTGHLESDLHVHSIAVRESFLCVIHLSWMRMSRFLKFHTFSCRYEIKQTIINRKTTSQNSCIKTWQLNFPTSYNDNEFDSFINKCLSLTNALKKYTFFARLDASHFPGFVRFRGVRRTSRPQTPWKVSQVISDYNTFPDIINIISLIYLTGFMVCRNSNIDWSKVANLLPYLLVWAAVCNKELSSFKA